MQNTWEAVVVGAGAAGLSAAQMLGRACRRTLVIDAGEPRNRFASHMHGVLGADGIDPAALLARGREEVAAYGVELRQAMVHSVVDRGETLELQLADGQIVTTRALVAATGLTDELPDIPGLADHWGSTVLHCPYCHGWEHRDGRLAVLATTPFAVHQAELLRQWSDRLTFFAAELGELEPEVEKRLRARGVEIVMDPVVAITGEQNGPLRIEIAGGAVSTVDALFTFGLPRPHEAFLASLDLARAEGPWGSMIEVDMMYRTSHPRVWAAGNLINPAANVPVAMGAGSMAGGAVNHGLVAEDFDRAVEGL